jgi:hypothetical protein
MDIEENLEIFEKKGFYFYQAWTMDDPITPDRIELPSREILSVAEIEAKLKRIDISNSKKCDELNRALEYYGLVRELEIGERQWYSSFRDEEDMQQCFERYRDVNPLV